MNEWWMSDEWYFQHVHIFISTHPLALKFCRQCYVTLKTLNTKFKALRTAFKKVTPKMKNENLKKLKKNLKLFRIAQNMP